MTQLGDAVESGGTFSEALAQHRAFSTSSYVNMVKAGELGGVLEIVLTRLAEFQEKSQKIKGKVVSAMVYPVVVLVIAGAILTFLLIFIVPKFQQNLRRRIAGQATAGHHRVCHHLQPYARRAVVRCRWRDCAQRRRLQGAVEHVGRHRVPGQDRAQVPVFGDLTSKDGDLPFSRTLGTLISSGVPILQALNITRDTAGNTVVANAINKIHDSVKEGESVVGPMEASGVFPPMVTSMVQVGEETGQLPDMLVKVADVYEAEVDNVVSGLTSILEPIMIVMLAVIVGTIVIALFMPMVGLITGMSEPGRRRSLNRQFKHPRTLCAGRW